jgi:hypothetical protein
VAKYAYIAAGPDGHTVTGVAKAADREAAELRCTSGNCVTSG